MTELIDFNAVRAELRAMDRGSLLIIAERAIELMPAMAPLQVLLGDFMHLTALPADAGNASAPLQDEVRVFCDAAMTGEYYETVEINNRGRQEQSGGTDAFIAEFHRLLNKCIGAAGQEAPSGVDGSFALLFGLLRQIDEGNHDVLFFADEGSSSDVGVNWRTALPAYFSYLARTSSPKDFARTVGEAIADFASHDGPRYWDVARNVASDEQRIALDALVT
jgi:hypothetical protein